MIKKITEKYHYLAKLKLFLLKYFFLKKYNVSEKSNLEKNYFIEARSWSDDLYTAAIISRNRYKISFFLAMALATLLAVAINALIPLQHIQPLLINHYPDGRISVQPTNQAYAPINQTQIESEIVRYVINREKFDTTSYHTQYSLINLLSNNEVAKEYINTQSFHNKASLINKLGAYGRRTVRVESVIFLDSDLKNKKKRLSKQTHHNLAQVNFTVTDQFKNSTSKKKKYLTALIAWTYRKMPNNPAELWRNWNGFTVTRYTVQRCNISDKEIIE